MNASISRDVVIDLLPVYLSGEGSPASRELVEAYMKEDPEFARIVQQASKAMSPALLTPERAGDHEIRALRRTRRLLRRRGWFLGFAIFFTLVTVSYQFGPDGFRWTFADSPASAVACLLTAGIFWIFYLRSRYRLKPTGI